MRRDLRETLVLFLKASAIRGSNAILRSFSMASFSLRSWQRVPTQASNAAPILVKTTLQTYCLGIFLISRIGGSESTTFRQPRAKSRISSNFNYKKVSKDFYTYRIVIRNKNILNFITKNGFFCAGSQLLAVPDRDGWVRGHINSCLRREEAPHLPLGAELGREVWCENILWLNVGLYDLGHWRV